MPPAASDTVFRQVAPTAAIARRALWAYMDDVVSRYAEHCEKTLS
jgi:hypothetical protein